MKPKKKKKKMNSRNFREPKVYSMELEHLRQEMLAVTLSILKLAKKRQQLALKIAEIKSSSGLAVEDLKVEEKLKERLSKYASELGLDESLEAELADLLISHSKIAQRKKIFRNSIISYLERNKIETISIIGAGRMGSWFAGYFRAFGTKVILFDKRVGFARSRAKELEISFGEDLRTIVRLSDLIFIAVPISETRRVIEKLEEISKTTTMESNHCKAIIEISSIKAETQRRNFNVEKIPLISIHPLFGSSALHFDPNTILVLGSQEKKEKGERSNFALQFVKGLFPQMQVLEMSAQAHDRQMALMLSLPHALALAFGHVINKKPGLISNKKVVTPSYFILREFASKVLSENPDVYYEIESMNKFTFEVLQELIASITTLLHYFERGAGGKLEFKNLFEGIKVKMKRRT
jgi:chorismate mutase